MHTYRVDVEYLTGAGREKSVAYDVVALSIQDAKSRVRQNFAYDLRRRDTTITKLDAKRLVEPTPFAVGQIVELRRGLLAQQSGGPFKASVRSLFAAVNGEQMVTIEHSTRTGLGRFNTLTVAGLQNALLPALTTTYYATYPDGTTYVNDRPILQSSHGIDNIVQVKVVREGNRVVSKEVI